MLLKSLKLKNFRQYKGDQYIEFSCEKIQNVTVILGDNTSGKTTLVQAFNWGLYGVANFNTKDFMLNIDVSKEMKLNETAEVEVEIELLHDNVNYIITRTQLYTCKTKGIDFEQSKSKLSYLQDDGQMETVRAVVVDSTINKILPKDLSSYFFFDGERIGNISNKNDVTESVKGLLGLSVLDNAMRHLNPGIKNSVVGRFKNSMNIDGNHTASEALQKMNDAMERKVLINMQLANIKSEILHYDMRRQELEELLRENQPTAELQRKKEDLERNILTETKYYKDSSKRLISDFNNNAIGLFSQPLMQGALNLFKETNVSDKGIPNMNGSSIDFIVKRGRCICGAEIVEGNKEHKHIMNEKEYLPPQSIGTMIRTFTKEISAYKNSGSNYSDNLKNNYSDIYRYKNRIREWEEEALEISKLIQGEDDGAKYEEELNDVKIRQRSNNEKRDRLMKEEGSCDSDIERNKKVYESLATVSEKNKQIWEYIKYAENIFEWIRSNYETKEQDIKEKLEAKVNEIFGKMYHGKRKVIIDDKYRVTLLSSYRDEHIKTDESRGLETVKNFAFIAGLVDLAREKIISSTSENDINLSSEPYPLVMDAPFSNADEKHVSNISKILPEIAEQIIMVVMSKDWTHAENVMGDKVGKRYTLRKQSETLTFVEELKS
jgi:DNA sulfur modification protein DndD